MRYALAVGLSFGILVSATAADAQAQLLTRTWVSGTGNDGNVCSRALPCLTFGGAIAKTAANGEINCLDAGSFGQVNITKSITIDCNGAVGGILAVGDQGVNVTAGSNDVVILRNLDINGAGSGTFGIIIHTGKLVIIENTRIAGFQFRGVSVQGMFGLGTISISNSTISTQVHPSQGIGVHSQGGITTVSHSVIIGNELGLFAEGASVINADSNVLTGNGTAVQTNGGTLRLSNNDVYGNLTGFGCGPGVLASAGNNRKGNNSGGTVAACSPTVAITQQ